MSYLEKSVGPARTCDFRSGKVILQQEISREQMEKLLTEGRTGLLDGFVSSRTNRKFKAFLVRQPDGKIGFEFEPRPENRPRAGQDGQQDGGDQDRHQDGHENGRQEGPGQEGGGEEDRDQDRRQENGQEDRGLSRNDRQPLRNARETGRFSLAAVCDRRMTNARNPPYCGIVYPAVPHTTEEDDMTASPLAARRRILTAAGALAGLSLIEGRVRSPAAGARGLRQGSIDPFFAAGYVALKRGYFGEAGLEVEYLNSQSGPRTNQLLAAGRSCSRRHRRARADAGRQAGHAGVRLRPQADLRQRDRAARGLRQRQDQVAERPGRQARGRDPAAVQHLADGAVPDAEGRRGRQGGHPPLGDLATMLGALKTGSVSASMATMSMMEQARQEGWGVPIFDATTEASWNEFMGGDVPGIAALTLADTIQKRPKRCKPSSARWSRRRISSAP